VDYIPLIRDTDMTTNVKFIGDEWVFIDSNIDFNDYYHKDSVIRKNNNIKVWVKRVYNQGNRIIDFIKQHINNDYLNNIHYSLLLYSINYTNYNYCIESLLHYNSCDVLLIDVKTNRQYKEIKSGSKVEKLIKQIINKA
jgi:hypothetical protein